MRIISWYACMTLLRTAEVMSMAKVNEMQGEKSLMIQDFVSGKNQNVHELMITLQKAGLAMERLLVYDCFVIRPGLSFRANARFQGPLRTCFWTW